MRSDTQGEAVAATGRSYKCAVQRLLRGLAFACLLLAGFPAAHAGITNATGTDLQVSLITYGPGDIYWERFGHDAIEIRDRVSGQSINFNYGVFDFEQKDFLLNFARGHMRYSIDAGPSAEEMGWYVQAGRWIQRQRLALTSQQAAALRDYLLWNLRPQNAQYDYDYYTNNCSIRVRDALDRVLGGALHKQLQSQPSTITFRSETDRLMSGQPWLMLMMDLGLGPFADQPLTSWQTAFIPMRLMHEMRHVRVADGRGGSQPLVVADTRLAEARLPAPPHAPPDLRLPLFLAGLTLALLLVVSGAWRERSRSARVTFGMAGTLYLLFAGVAGILMIALWAFTAHRSAWANQNLLLFNPLALLLLPAVWRVRGTRFSRILVMMLAVIAACALPARLLPGVTQHNLPWIAFALPVWLALAWVSTRAVRAMRRQTVPASPR